MQKCLDELQLLGPLMVPIIVEIRRELELPIDEQAYAKLFLESQESQKSIIGVP